MPTMLDGSNLSWEILAARAPDLPFAPGMKLPLRLTMSSPKPGQVVRVDYRIDGGTVHQLQALPVEVTGPLRIYQAMLPTSTPGRIEFLPVVYFADRPESARLEQALNPPSYQVGGDLEDRAEKLSVEGLPTGKPLWEWTTDYLGTLAADLSLDVVGPTPEGIPFKWLVTQAYFNGPGLKAHALPGASDYMLIRPDGIGIANVRVCLRGEGGEQIFGLYHGLADFGPDGYARALRHDYDRFPPAYITPRYLTAEPRLQWLNRLQCIGVGRIDTQKMQVHFDVYRLRVGDLLHAR